MKQIDAERQTLDVRRWTLDARKTNVRHRGRGRIDSGLTSNV